MTPYIVNIASSGTSETLLTAAAGRTLRSIAIVITAPQGGFDATLTLSRQGVDSILLKQTKEDGQSVDNTTPYLFDPQSTLTFIGTEGLSIVFMAEIL